MAGKLIITESIRGSFSDLMQRVPGTLKVLVVASKSILTAQKEDRFTDFDRNFWVWTNPEQLRALSKMQFDCLIVLSGNMFCNIRSKRTEQLTRIARDTPIKYVLLRPADLKVEGIYPLMQILGEEKKLGTFHEFRNKYFSPADFGQHAARAPKLNSLEAVMKRIKPITRKD